ncbi:MAG: glycosyltransferase [Caulobacteraceae bacterium]|nr:glycosyltransferase [Caulobacteraceae bacterium]
MERGYSEAGLVLTNLFCEHFGDDERFLEFRLRFLLALNRLDQLVADIAGLIDRGPQSVQLAYRAALSLDRAADSGRRIDADLNARAIRCFLDVAERSREKEMWLGRYCRQVGNTSASMSHYRAAWEGMPKSNRYRAVALREALDIALSGDQWGRDAEILLTAREEKIKASLPWRAAAVGKAFDHIGAGNALDSQARLPQTDVYSQLYATVASPQIAFDYLLDESLPGRTPYSPTNSLLMIGTSLSAGGMERIFANSYRAVAAAGVFARVHLAVLNFDSESPTAFYLPETGASADDITVLANEGTPDFPVSLLPVGLGRRVLQAYQLILRERPRIIHAWNDLPGIIAAFAGLLAGCPRIFVHFHHMRAINLSSDRSLIRSYPACFRRLLERPEIELLFVADACAEDYADWWCVSRSEKFRKLYNGFPKPDSEPFSAEDIRRKLDLPSRALILGTVFRFHAVKRPFLWIDAASLVHRALPDVHFVMVGDGALWEDSRAYAENQGLRDHLHFTGQVKNVADYLSCFDLFMLTSSSEGLPNSLVEAQLSGVPVLSTDVGGARETFTPGLTGWLVSEASAEALASAAVACLGDDEWRERAANESRPNALKYFSIDRYIERLLALYDDFEVDKTGGS